MLTRWLSLSLVALVLAPMVVPSAHAATSADRADTAQADRSEKVKISIARLGTDPDARVTIRLRDGTQRKGYVSEAGESSFVVTDRSGLATRVPYPDVTKVHGQNLRTRWKVVIGAAVTAGIVITLVLVRGAFCDGC